MNGFYIFISLLLGFVLCFLTYVGFRKNQTMTVYFPDGSWFKGIRKWNYPARETHGTHHFMVVNGSPEFKEHIGKKIAVPIESVKYFVLER